MNSECDGAFYAIASHGGLVERELAKNWMCSKETAFQLAPKRSENSTSLSPDQRL